MTRFLIMSMVFVGVSGITVLAAHLARQARRQRERVKTLVSTDEPTAARPERDILSEFFFVTLPRISGSMLPQEGAKKTQQRQLLIQAGLYRPEHLALFHGARIVLACLPGIGFLLGCVFHVWDLAREWVVVAMLLTVAAMMLPNAWLNRRKRARQTLLRGTLPDALDLIMICLEGGLSLPAALSRIARELTTVHPDLAIEMTIVERYIQMGRSAGEALRLFADRCDLEEVRSLSSAVLQSERFGASLTSSLSVQTEMLRLKRLQIAEEKAHKASVKVLFPTLLLIFPAVFIVLIGPAGLQIVEVFDKMNASASAAADFPMVP